MLLSKHHTRISNHTHHCKYEASDARKRARRRFEYRLQSRGVDKKDFLDYITYELNLGNSEETAKEGDGSSETIKRRLTWEFVEFIPFSRALKKFQEDIRLWLQYADFCARSGSTRSLARLFPKGLAAKNPRSVGLWLMPRVSRSVATTITTSRTILQRVFESTKSRRNCGSRVFSYGTFVSSTNSNET